MPSTPFEELYRIANESGVEKTLDFLEHHFRKDKSYFKLFEVLKMRCRHQLGLPLIYTQQPDDLDDARQRQLEDGLLSACREIGTLFFKQGQFQEGWMYLQAVGDSTLNDRLMRSIPVDEENLDAVIDIAVSQGAAPVYGYGQLLKSYGTCNGITTFDTQAARFDLNTQKKMAIELLNHIYDELVGNIQYALGEAQAQAQASGEGQPAQVAAASSLEAARSELSLGELMQANSDLTANGAHHIDTTHLSSLMRIVRIIDSTSELRKASELAEYGSRLHEDFQYPGTAPFEDTYIDHAFYFGALLGENVDDAVAHFEAKIKKHPADEFGPIAEETLVALLVRVGRNDQAVAIMTERLLGNFEPLGIAPQPFEVANSPATRDHMKRYYESKEDLLGFAVSVLPDVPK